MKKILYFALPLFLVACNEQSTETGSTENQALQVENTEELSDEPLTGFFGEPITADDAISVQDFKKMIASGDSVQVKLAANINSTCRKKGCWMRVDLEDGEEMLVRFKDYGFFVPKNADGFKTVMEGVAKKTTVTVDELKHYAEDAGKSAEEIAAITEPETKYTFEATGVIVYE
jgi:hypothetical protein